MEKEITVFELMDLLIELMTDLAESNGWNHKDKNFDEFYDEFTLRDFMEHLAENSNTTYIINIE